MAAKFSLALLVVFVVFQMVTWESQAIVVRREVPATEKNASQAIDDAIKSFKTGLDDLVKKIQENELIQNATQSLKQFGELVQQQGKDLVEKIQTDTKSKN